MLCRNLDVAIVSCTTMLKLAPNEYKHVCSSISIDLLHKFEGSLVTMLLSFQLDDRSCDGDINIPIYTYTIFIFVHNFMLSKLNKTSNSMACTSKQKLELDAILTINTIHIQTTELELETISFPS
jgi:hypothetical protein